MTREFTSAPSWSVQRKSSTLRSGGIFSETVTSSPSGLFSKALGSNEPRHFFALSLTLAEGRSLYELLRAPPVKIESVFVLSCDRAERARESANF